MCQNMHILIRVLKVYKNIPVFNYEMLEETVFWKWKSFSFEFLVVSDFLGV